MKDFFTTLGTLRDYQRLFQAPGFTYVGSSVFMEHYKRLNCVVTIRNGTWTSYLPKNIMKQTLADGLHIYHHKEGFDDLVNRFETYVQSSRTYYECVLAKETLSRDDVVTFFIYLSELFSHYSQTEFFYTDRAFLDLEHSPSLQTIYSRFGDFKIQGREYLNTTLFGETSYLNQCIAKLSEQFVIDTHELVHYTLNELVSLFSGVSVNASHTCQRTEACIKVGKDGVVHALVGDEAIPYIDQFLQRCDAQPLHEISGTAVNPGVVTGRAKVFRLDYSQFEHIAAFVESMEEDQIMVAESTAPEIITACKKAAAIVTNQGGIVSHAAIVARELDIPCIVGTGNATEIINDGDLIEVDADRGIVTIVS